METRGREGIVEARGRGGAKRRVEGANSGSEGEGRRKAKGGERAERNGNNVELVEGRKEVKE